MGNPKIGLYEKIDVFLLENGSLPKHVGGEIKYKIIENCAFSWS
jgi:hypothetical protein